MVDKIQLLLEKQSRHGNSFRVKAFELLDLIEKSGMLPPQMEGVYDPVPTVTPTGNHEYSWKRGWQKE